MKKFTADEFRQNPAIVYRLADKGEKIEIAHSRYPDKKIIIFSVDRMEVEDGTNN